MKRQIWRWWVKGFWVGCLLLVLAGCSQEAVTSAPPPLNPPPQSLTPRPSIEVVESLAAIATLNDALMAYEPEVTILSPKPDEILTDTAVRIRLRVENLPIYIDDTWQLGPHLHVLLDNQQSYAVYDTSEPLALTDLAPGTHTLRVVAAKPWHESFKTIGAYAQTTFHVFAKTGENQPDPGQPSLIYSQPEGSYGAEPILVDFHLSGLPLHMIAQESDLDTIKDWHLRCTVNGDSLRIDTWEPVYLKGLKPGQNWVQLMLEDEDDQPIVNTFNNTVRLVDYQPDGADTLSKLMRGELVASEVMGIVDPDYVPPPSPPPIEVEPDEPDDAPGEDESVEPSLAPSTADEPGMLEKPETIDESWEEAAAELTVTDLDEPELEALELTVPEPELSEPESADSAEGQLLDATKTEQEEPEVPQRTEPELDVPQQDLEPEQTESAAASALTPETDQDESDSAELPFTSAEDAVPDVVLDPLDPVEAERQTPIQEETPAEAVDDAIQNLTTMDSEASPVPDEEDPRVENQDEEPTAGRRLFKRLYEYRDRSLETYGSN